MDQQWQRSRVKGLWILVLFGTAYSSLFYYEPTLTGAHNVDGVVGVLLGLYICSRPAANVVDLLFFGRAGQSGFPLKRSAAVWWVLNALAFVAGWVAIFVGTTRLIGRGE